MRTLTELFEHLSRVSGMVCLVTATCAGPSTMSTTGWRHSPAISAAAGIASWGETQDWAATSIVDSALESIAPTIDVLNAADDELTKAEKILRGAERCNDPAIDTYVDVLKAALRECEANTQATRWSRLTAALVVARASLSEALSTLEAWRTVFEALDEGRDVPDRFAVAPVALLGDPWSQDEFMETMDDLAALEG